VQRICKIIVVFILVGVSKIQAQVKMPIFLPNSTVLTTINGKSILASPLAGLSRTTDSLIPLKLTGTGLASTPGTTPLKPGFYVDQLKGFCKIEWQVEKRFNLPLRFRLGSLDYTNALEGKKQ